MSTLDEMMSAIVEEFHGGRRELMTKPELERAHGFARLFCEQGARPTEFVQATRAWKRTYSFPPSLRSIFERFTQLLDLPEPPPPKSYPYRDWEPRDAWEKPSEAEMARVKAQLDRVRRRSAQMETEWVYGYGKTKHIRDPRYAGYRSGEEFGLCGAPGGYPHPEPDRPVCKRCSKMDESRSA